MNKKRKLKRQTIPNNNTMDCRILDGIRKLTPMHAAESASNSRKIAYRTQTGFPVPLARICPYRRRAHLGPSRAKTRTITSSPAKAVHNTICICSCSWRHAGHVPAEYSSGDLPRASTCYYLWNSGRPKNMPLTADQRNLNLRTCGCSHRPDPYPSPLVVRGWTWDEVNEVGKDIDFSHLTIIPLHLQRPLEEAGWSPPKGHRSGGHDTSEIRPLEPLVSDGSFKRVSMVVNSVISKNASPIIAPTVRPAPPNASAAAASADQIPPLQKRSV